MFGSPEEIPNSYVRFTWGIKGGFITCFAVTAENSHRVPNPSLCAVWAVCDDRTLEWTSLGRNRFCVTCEITRHRESPRHSKIAAVVVVPAGRRLVAVSGHVGQDANGKNFDDLSAEFTAALDVSTTTSSNSDLV